VLVAAAVVRALEMTRLGLVELAAVVLVQTPLT
jgi:hypothetical protein